MSKEKLSAIMEELYDICIDVKPSDFISELDHLLDMLLDEDFFGTEGQLDPRQDWRN